VTFSPLSLHGISKFKKKKKKTLNKTISYIQTDNGIEFSNIKISIFFFAEIIVLFIDSPVPYNPPAEWKNRKIQWNFHFSLQKSLLSDSQLSHQFWEFAVDTANNIHNRIPHRWDINNKIPFEIINKFQRGRLSL